MYRAHCPPNCWDFGSVLGSKGVGLWGVIFYCIYFIVCFIFFWYLWHSYGAFQCVSLRNNKNVLLWHLVSAPFSFLFSVRRHRLHQGTGSRAKEAESRRKGCIRKRDSARAIWFKKNRWDAGKKDGERGKYGGES